ncbi:MAG: DUF423 domain-containing protein [Aggregatilineales bacterium]
MMQKRWVMFAGILGAIGVAIGAFGAHGLEDLLIENGRLDTFETANRYHMYHVLALLAVAWLSDRYPVRLVNIAGWAFVAGIVLFSGSLYVLAILNIGIMGAIAPIGGAALIIGWLCVAGVTLKD